MGYERANAKGSKIKTLGGVKMDQYKKRIHLKNTEIGSLKAKVGNLQRALDEMTKSRDIWKEHFDKIHLQYDGCFGSRADLLKRVEELEFLLAKSENDLLMMQPMPMDGIVSKDDAMVEELEQKNQALEFEIKALKASEAFADYYRNYYKEQYAALLDHVGTGNSVEVKPVALSNETTTLLEHAAKVHMEYIEAMKGPTSLIVKDLPDDALADMLEQMKHTGLIFAPDNSTVDFLGLDIDKGVMSKDDALDALRYIPKEYWENPNKSGVTPRGEAMGMMDAISCSMQEASDCINKPEIVAISSDDRKPPYFDLDD